MKRYSETERLEHVANWRSGTLSKTAYAKLKGITPTTFYTWVAGSETDFVEIGRGREHTGIQDIVIEKGSITIRVPLSIDLKELRTVMSALGSEQ
jgi:hypothetical protein